MFKNYLRVALRGISKNKLYSFVNIAGLTSGIVGCILIGMYIWNELSYDNFHTHANRIARVTMEYNSSGTVNSTAVTGSKVGPQFKRTFPQVEAYTRTYKYPRTIANGTKVFEETNSLYADASFFQTFSFKLLRGNANTALELPYTVVLTESTAKKYFGNEDPIGKTVKVNAMRDYEVTGIVADAPLNSQIRFDIILSFTSLNAANNEEWFSANYITYLLLKDGSQMGRLGEQIDQYMQKVSREELKFPAGTSNYLTYNLEPLLKVHLYSPLNGLEPNGNITYVYVLGIVAILILLIACVNYTNLATAQSAGRGTEIGVRKVLGAGKPQLYKQFLGESFILTTVAMVLAIFASIALLPLFNAITGKGFTASLLFKPITLAILLLLTIFISLLAGAYPAFILSNTGIIQVLKSGVRVSNSSGSLRKALIVFQFVISVFLVISTIVVSRQVSFIQNKKLGYDREHIVVLPVDTKMKTIYGPLKKAMAQNPGVLSITGAYEDPTFIEWGDGITVDNGKEKKDISVAGTPVDLDYIKTMGMQLAAGRDFIISDFALQDTSDSYKNYRRSYILNERAVAAIGWTPEEAIGKTIEDRPGVITGVVKDFHFTSLHTPIEPLVMFLDTSLTRQMFVKIKGSNTTATLQALEATWKQRINYRPFDYHFLDEDFNKLYITEQRTAKVFTLFSSLAIALAALGLFALAAYSAVQRTKEIGIRKILGANTPSIVFMIAKQFVALVTIGILIATPIAWWAGNQWLQDFAYRIHISWWMFVVAGVSALAIALVTVSYHAIKVSLTNPVKSLRTE